MSPTVAERKQNERWRPVTPEECAALDTLGREGRWTVAGRQVRLTNLDKILFPGTKTEPPATKRDLIRYYAQIAPYLLPYLAGRPVNARRYPDGVHQPGFWHKEVPDHAPEWLNQWHNTEAAADEAHCYAVLDSVPALVWMANFGGIELHPWTSWLPKVHEPAWALIDIDPGAHTGFGDILTLARLYRTALEHLDVVGIPKVTGQRGIQVWIPVRAGYTFEDTRRWVRVVSHVVGRTVPDLVSWQWYRDRRGGLARLDYTQNAINKTLVAPFGVRPRSHAPVSMPITWDDLDDPDLRPDRWTIRTALDRVHRVGDPLAELIGKPQDLPSL